jgi:hypothetical protein
MKKQQNFDLVFGCWHCVEVGHVIDVSDEHTALSLELHSATIQNTTTYFHIIAKT